MGKKFKKFLQSSPCSLDLHNAIILNFSKNKDILEITLLINSYHFCINEINDYFYPCEFVICKLNFMGVKDFKSNEMNNFRYLDSEVLENCLKDGTMYFKLKDYDQIINNISFNYDNFEWVIVDSFEKKFYNKWFQEQVNQGIFNLEKRSNRDNFKKIELEKFLNIRPDSISLHDSCLLKFNLSNNSVKFTIKISNYGYLVNGIEDYVDFNKYTILELEFEGIKNVTLETDNEFEFEYSEIMDNYINKEDNKFYICLYDGEDSYMSFNFDDFKWNVIGYIYDKSYGELEYESDIK